jgi:hypothetical protein
LRGLQQVALAVAEGFHLRRAAGIGHRFAFGAAQQQRVRTTRAKVSAMDTAYSGWV